MSFSTVRQKIKAKRCLLSQEVKVAAAARFTEQLLQSALLPHNPSHIAVYLAHGGELDLAPTIEMLWQRGHQLYLPVLAQEGRLHFAPYQKDRPLQKNALGISEPIANDFKDPKDLDMVLVPLVAFDKANHRIGMGKGYYDKTFSFRKHQLKPVLIGCAYAFQEVPLFKPAAHDVLMDAVLF